MTKNFQVQQHDHALSTPYKIAVKGEHLTDGLNVTKSAHGTMEPETWTKRNKIFQMA